MAGPVLTTDRSADAVTVVVVESVLSLGSGSGVGDVTDTAFVNVPAWAGAVTTTEIGAVAPAARSARVHVTEVFATFVHTQPAPVAETNVTPAGNVSTTDTFAASEGPALATVRV